jgi:cell wall-associated NlpC family hydrolase
MSMSSGAFIGAALGVGAVRELIMAGQAEQQAMVQLQRAAATAHLSWRRVRGPIEEVLASTRRLSGFTVTELTPAYAMFLRTTGNAAQAQKDLTAAVNLSRGRHIDLERATMIVNRAQIGMVGSLRRIGIDIPAVTTAEDHLRDAHIKATAELRRHAKQWDMHATGIKAVQVLTQRYAGSAQGYMRTAAGAASRLHANWEALQVVLARALLPTISRGINNLAAWVGQVTRNGQAMRFFQGMIHAVAAAWHLVVPPVAAAVRLFLQVVHVVGGFRNAFALILGGMLAVKLASVGAATGRWLTQVKLIPRESRLAAAAYGSSTAAMEVETVALSTVIKSALISTGIGAIVVAAGLAAAYVITHWQKVKGWFAAFGHWARQNAPLIGAALLGPLGWAAGMVIKHWSAVRAWFVNFAHDLSGLFQHPLATIEALFRDLGSAIAGALRAAINDFVNAIKSLHIHITTWHHLPKGISVDWGGGSGSSTSSVAPSPEDLRGTAGSPSYTAPGTRRRTGGGGGGGGGGLGAYPGQGAMPGGGMAGSSGSRRRARHQGGPTGGDVARFAGGVAADPASRAAGFHLPGERTPYDCSAFVQAVYRRYGINVGSTTYQQRNAGEAVPVGRIMPGDIVLWNVAADSQPPPNHVGIYLGGGMCAHDHGQSGGVGTMPLHTYPIVTVRRVMQVGGATGPTGLGGGGHHVSAATRARQAATRARTAADRHVGGMVAGIRRQVQAITGRPGIVTGRAEAAGMDTSSPEYLSLEEGALRQEVHGLARVRRELHKALRYATQHHLQARVQQIRAMLASIGQQIAKTMVDIAKVHHDRVVALIAREGARAQHRTTMAQGAVGQLEARQRLAGITDSPEAMRARAALISGQVVPAMQSQLLNLNRQLGVARKGVMVRGHRVVDENAVNQLIEQIQGMTTDILSAQADAADLIRQAAEASKQAAEAAAQAAVDSARHGETMANLGLDTLGLQQQIAGTYDTAAGQQARANYIRSVIIPQMQNVVGGLQGQLAVAQQQGDATLADQIAEAIAQQQNGILQEQLDAMNVVADNTAPLQDFTGSLGFEFNGQQFSDLLGAGVGA